MTGPVDHRVPQGAHRDRLEDMTLPDRLEYLADVSADPRDDVEPARWAAERIRALELALGRIASSGPDGRSHVDCMREAALALAAPWGPPSGMDYYGREPSEQFPAWDASA